MSMLCELDSIVYYGVCPYDKAKDQRFWLEWKARSDISGLPMTQCAIRFFENENQMTGTVRERVIEDVEYALCELLSRKTWEKCKDILQQDASSKQRPDDFLQAISSENNLDLLHVWYCLQSYKPTMKWRNKSDIRPILGPFTEKNTLNISLIHIGCSILQTLHKNKEIKGSLRTKRYAHIPYTQLSDLQKRERIIEAHYYNAAQTATVPSISLLQAVFDPNTLLKMEQHWQSAQGLIIFDTGKIRKNKGAQRVSHKRVKKSKDYLTVLHQMIYSLLLNEEYQMSAPFLAEIILDNYGMPDKSSKEIKEECIRVINKVRRVIAT